MILQNFEKPRGGKLFQTKMLGRFKPVLGFVKTTGLINPAFFKSASTFYALYITFVKNSQLILDWY